MNIATVSKAIPRRVSTTPADGCSPQSVSICVRIPVPLVHPPFRSSPVQKICFQNIYLISMQKGSTGITGMENILAGTPAHLRRARLGWEVMQGARPSICGNNFGEILDTQEITEMCTVSGAPSTHPSGISVGEKGWMQHHHCLQTPEIQQGPDVAEGMGMGPALKALSPAVFCTSERCLEGRFSKLGRLGVSSWQTFRAAAFFFAVLACKGKPNVAN